MNIYTVTAYRWGDRECHSYIVGVYDNRDEAIQSSYDALEWRGGKYECEVLMFPIGGGNIDTESPVMDRKVIKPLSKI